MTADPEQTLPPRPSDDIVEKDGTVIAVVGDVHLGIDGMGRDEDEDDLDPVPGGNDDLDPVPGGDDHPGKEDSGDG
jgi:hypothetical protein